MRRDAVKTQRQILSTIAFLKLEIPADTSRCLSARKAGVDGDLPDRTFPQPTSHAAGQLRANQNRRSCHALHPRAPASLVVHVRGDVFVGERANRCRRDGISRPASRLRSLPHGSRWHAHSLLPPRQLSPSTRDTLFSIRFFRPVFQPLIPGAALDFDLRKLVFDDTVSSAEDWLVSADFVEARPHRRGRGIFDDEPLKSLWGVPSCLRSSTLMPAILTESSHATAASTAWIISGLGLIDAHKGHGRCRRFSHPLIDAGSKRPRWTRREVLFIMLRAPRGQACRQP